MPKAADTIKRSALYKTQIFQSQYDSYKLPLFLFAINSQSARAMTTTDFTMQRSASHLSPLTRQISRWRKFGMASLCGSLFLLAGCGEARTGPETVPVSGTLTVDGKPVEGAKVTFVHETFAAFGKTDASGKFELAPGAVPGENKVVFSKWEGGPGGEEEGFDDEQLRMMAESGAPDAPKQIIPQQYTNEATTTLTFSVPEDGSTEANFDL